MKRALLTLVTLLILVAVGSAYSKTLGRLFFTPEQRKQLDSAKFQHDESGNSVQSLTVNGIVQRHGGRRTVWVNGVPQLAGKSDEQAPASFPLDVPGANKPVRVKVGQRVMVDSVAETGK
ncbi:MAG: hypothetical protein WA632_06225 [Gallionella sp.]